MNQLRLLACCLLLCAAGGVLAETYVECDNRGRFQNGHEFEQLYPDIDPPKWAYCAPRIEHGDELAAVRRKLDDRLEALGLIRTVEEQRTSQGPVRSLFQATPAGDTAAAAWLGTPVQHPRDVRSELMVKLALLDRSGTDSRDLLRAQLARLLPVAAALEDRLRATTGFEHTLVLWRHEAMTATLRFLQTLAAPDEVRTS